MQPRHGWRHKLGAKANDPTDSHGDGAEALQLGKGEGFWEEVMFKGLPGFSQIFLGFCGFGGVYSNFRSTVCFVKDEQIEQ